MPKRKWRIRVVLVTNDRDLLDISDQDKRKFKFQIVTPGQFLKQWDALQ
ncbi:MAG TPA: hypothetical protein VJZ91_00350 [Blastocatellia bacterium]|nr:hypothetical protein [Blastocatellia bacterium]